MEAPRVYPSAIDAWFFPSMFGGPVLVCTAVSFITKGNWGTGLLIGVAVGVVTLVALRPFTRPCDYTLSDDVLRIRSGFLEISIAVAHIERAECIRSYWAAPCLSVHRVLITHAGGQEMISPLDREAFIADLMSRRVRSGVPRRAADL